MTTLLDHGAHARDHPRDALAGAGVTVGGDAPWDIQIHDPRVYARVLRDGTLGVGEAFVEGWWDCQALDQMIDRIVRRGSFRACSARAGPPGRQAVKARLFNLQLARAFEVGERHYDIGNDLYEAMLGRRMVYTCAYFKDADTLDAAQDAKLDLVCRKIGLRAGMRVLDLGCGWGGFAAFAAERYGATVVGYTVSREQVAWAKQHYAGLPVDIRLDDYRNATGTYDAVVSIGLMEHVGPKNYRGYMELVARRLAPGGIAFIHTIGGASPRTHIDPWFDKYIFPNAAIPTHRPARDRDGGHPGPRGRPEHRPALRPHADGLVGQLRRGLAPAARPVRRRLLPNLEVLPAGERRLLPHPPAQPLPDRGDPGGRAPAAHRARDLTGAHPHGSPANFSLSCQRCAASASSWATELGAASWAST